MGFYLVMMNVHKETCGLISAWCQFLQFHNFMEFSDEFVIINSSTCVMLLNASDEERENLWNQTLMKSSYQSCSPRGGGASASAERPLQSEVIVYFHFTVFLYFVTLLFSCGFIVCINH